MRELLCIVAIASVAGGCSPSLPSKPKTFPVHGTVSLQGSPVHGGELEFLPVDVSAGGIDGRAVIDKDGAYKASSFVDQEGMVPGEYKVRLKQYVGMPGKLGAEPTVIPKKYLEFDTAGLKYSVKGEDNSIDIPLE